MVYSVGAEVLDCAFNENDPTQNTNQGGNVRLAVHEYGKGRAVYLFGLFDSFDAFPLFYKSLPWASHKEADYQKALSSSPSVDCYYYDNTGSYALLNNLGEEEKTIFYDIHGKPTEMTLKGHEIRWIAKE